MADAIAKLQKWQAHRRALWAGCVSAAPFGIWSFFSFVIAPKFQEIFEGLGGRMPSPTRFLIEVNAVAIRFWSLYVMAMIVCWAATSRYLIRGRSRVLRRALWVVCGLVPVLFVVFVFFTLFLPVFDFPVLVEH